MECSRFSKMFGTVPFLIVIHCWFFWGTIHLQNMENKKEGERGSLSISHTATSRRSDTLRRALGWQQGGGSLTSFGTAKFRREAYMGHLNIDPSFPETLDGPSRSVKPAQWEADWGRASTNFGHSQLVWLLKALVAIDKCWFMLVYIGIS